MKKLFMLNLLGCWISLSAFAYMDNLDVAEPIAPKSYKVTAGPQFILSGFKGVNLISRVDYGLKPGSSVRGVIGFGKVDFQLGAFYKWNPIPDIDRQPAVSLMAGGLMGADRGRDEWSLRAHPIVSKRFENAEVKVNPYLAVPFGWTSTKDKSTFPVHLAPGIEAKVKAVPNFSFIAEAGINIHDAFGYFSIGVSIVFNESGKVGPEENLAL